MISVILVGFIGGVITALSPCILPVLPVVLGVSVGRKPVSYTHLTLPTIYSV